MAAENARIRADEYAKSAEKSEKSLAKGKKHAQILRAGLCQCPAAKQCGEGMRASALYDIGLFFHRSLHPYFGI